MTKNYRLVGSDDSLPSRVLSNIPHEAKSLKGDHPPPKYILSPVPPAQAQEHPLAQEAVAMAARVEFYIEGEMKAYAEDLKSKHSVFDEKHPFRAEDFEDISIGQSTAVENAYNVTLLPKRLKPSVIMIPDSAASSDDEDDYDDEEWKRYEKEINDSASMLNQNISEKIEEERKAYLAAAGKRYRKAKAESPSKAKQEREEGVAIFKKLMEWANTVLDKVVEIFNSFFRRFSENIQTAMSWVREQLARISHTERLKKLEYTA
ncbi:hypothetical protein TWF281_007051 [Arthrobotrys megalospora]